MDRKLIITTGTKKNFYLILEDNTPVELKVEDIEMSKQAGNIYKGKVISYSSAMEAYFVDIGEDKEAFLPKKDVCEEECKNLKKGSVILVQVKRSPVSTKGAKLSCKLSLPGKFLVLLPQNKGKVSISSKYEDQEIRDNLKKRITNLINQLNPDNYGIIIRTSAINATDEEIIEDFQFLKRLWEEIKKDSEKLKAPALVYEEPFKAFTIVRDYAADFSEVVCDDIKILKQIKSFISENFPNSTVKLTPYRKRKQSLFFEYGIDKVINKILSPYAYMKSGSYLVIQETEALVVIDVNSGSCHKQKNLEETAFKINTEAIKEIVRQIRLRDLAGIIIIDFIDMIEKEHKEKLLEMLKEEFKKDKRPVKIKGLTQLGLVELSRKKIEESLVKQLSQSCQVCYGKGYLRSEEVLLFEIEKTLQKLKPYSKLKLVLNPKLSYEINKLLENLNLKDVVEIEYNNKMHVDKYEVEKIL
ncbi:Rne/Rng family ribonuclease [Sulfurihydrogenibium sp.]|uniref:Rne/Rng family ribonuclease n=1 Tax=Sulfurihydrogenibium sp. TaxID=2053621 RepID=UPI0026156BB3|nr:Rne/Rng family ribonuclease [Sulfurihydrogenibium sp.]